MSIVQAHTMWDHTKTITQLLPALPSVGICEMHGIDSHVCSMYTASEDRFCISSSSRAFSFYWLCC